MRRIGLVLACTIGLAIAPLAVEAQPAGKVPRVGVVGELGPTDSLLEAFRQGLRELGYTEGQNIIIEYRYVQGAANRDGPRRRANQT
jgi:putative tryptophan/tyrosine transport system substrate-binding protein